MHAYCCHGLLLLFIICLRVSLSLVISGSHGSSGIGRQVENEHLCMLCGVACVDCNFKMYWQPEPFV